MFGFLIGWGVFWLLIWVTVMLVGLITNEDKWIGTGMLWIMISACYLIAVLVGRAVM